MPGYAPQGERPRSYPAKLGKSRGVTSLRACVGMDGQLPCLPLLNTDESIEALKLWGKGAIPWANDVNYSQLKFRRYIIYPHNATHQAVLNELHSISNAALSRPSQLFPTLHPRQYEKLKNRCSRVSSRKPNSSKTIPLFRSATIVSTSISLHTRAAPLIEPSTANASSPRASRAVRFTHPGRFLQDR